MKKKNNKYKSLIYGFVFILLVVSIISIVNYIYINIKWGKYDLPGLKFTSQNENTKYFGEEYFCDDNKILYIDIKGSYNNIRDRVAQINMIDSYSGAAGTHDMKLKDVNENEVMYTYKENSLTIDKNGMATFLINEIPILSNCEKR